MFRREMMKIGTAGLIGLILGLVYAYGRSMWEYAALGPFYLIGLFYGGRYLILGGGKIFGAWFMSLFHGGFAGFLFRTILMLAGLFVLSTFGWIFGLVLAGQALFSAKSQDMLLGTTSDRREIDGKNSSALSTDGVSDFDTWNGNNKLGKGDAGGSQLNSGDDWSNGSSNSGGSGGRTLPNGRSDSGGDGFDF